MKDLIRKARILSMIVLVMTFLGCEDDDEGTALPAVTAGFTFDLIQGSGTVSFINISENAQKFEWDFRGLRQCLHLKNSLHYSDNCP